MLKIQKRSGGGLAAKLSENGFKNHQFYEPGDFYIVETKFYKAQGSLRGKLHSRLMKAASALNNKNVKSVEMSSSNRVVYINGCAVNLNLWD